MEDPTPITQLILNLLSSSSPELGARLKQRLNAALSSKGLGPFNERAYGVKRFSNFLEQALGERVFIDRPQGAGDIRVSLRRPQSFQESKWTEGPQEARGKVPVIRSDIWQAFTNPDPERKRFFHRETRVIRHYLQGESSSIKIEVDGEPEKFIEVEPIDRDVQIDWMRAFLDSVRMAPSDRAPLDALIGDHYSSGVNATFTRALGLHGNAWRLFRTHNVTSLIQKWAQQHGVPFEHLCVEKDPTPALSSLVHDNELRLPARQQAAKLLELLTEEDISKLVLPILLSTIMVKSRL